MQPNDQLKAKLFWEKVARAQAMTPEQRVLTGARLFDYACKITKEGIRSQHPEASEEEVQALLEQRLEMRRRMDEEELRNIQQRKRERNGET